MKLPLSRSYLDKLFCDGGLDKLAQISALACGAEAFDKVAPDYGLPARLFAFVEGLEWISQALRSGSWTYFEVTPVARQQMMLECLKVDGMPGLADRYSESMSSWQDAPSMAAIDRWLNANEVAIDGWLAERAIAARADFEEVV